MTKREKTLGTVMALVVGSLGWQRVSRIQREEAAMFRAQLVAARSRVEASRALMASAPKVEETDRRPAAYNDTTMRMMKDLTVPTEIKEVVIEGVDHSSPTDYRVSLNGEFKGLMRYLSYLERPEGDFRVKHVEMARALPVAAKDADDGARPPRRVRGVFVLSRRG